MDTPTGNGPPEQSTKPRVSGAGAQLLLDSIIPYQINQLAHNMNRILDLELRSQGLSISMWRIMAALDFNAAVPVKDLARHAMIEQSTLSRILKKMQAEGLLENKKSEVDGRVHKIMLTEAGRHRYGAVREITMRHVGRIVHGFDAQERADLARYIARMQSNLTADLSG